MTDCGTASSASSCWSTWSRRSAFCRDPPCARGQRAGGDLGAEPVQLDRGLSRAARPGRPEGHLSSLPTPVVVNVLALAGLRVERRRGTFVRLPRTVKLISANGMTARSRLYLVRRDDRARFAGRALETLGQSRVRARPGRGDVNQPVAAGRRLPPLPGPTRPGCLEAGPAATVRPRLEATERGILAPEEWRR
jgi:hypothetical protein